MIVHSAKSRPESWSTLRAGVKHEWLVPFLALEWVWEWMAYGLSRWRFLEVLEYLSTLSVLVGVVFYFSESGARVEQRHYQAWQVINTAQGKGGSGGRIEALEELNRDKVSLVGVDVSSSFLQGVQLEGARLARANFSTADVRECDLERADIEDGELHLSNFRSADLAGALLMGADLSEADLVGADLSGANLARVDLSGADMRRTKLRGIRWEQIEKMEGANIAGVQDAPAGFVAWAMQHGAIQQDAGGD